MLASFLRVCFFLLVPFSFFARAATEETEIVVTASPVRHLGETVRNQQELEQEPGESLGQKLKSEPGLSVVTTGGAGGVTSFFLRGASSSHLAVWLDGVPFNDPSHPSRGTDLSFVPGNGWSTFRLLRGSRTVRYGDDALAGILLLESPTTSTTRAHARFEGGSNVSRSLSLSGGTGSETWSTFHRLEWLDTQGISDAHPRTGAAEPDSFQRLHLHHTFGKQWTPKLSSRLTLFSLLSRKELDDTVGGTFRDTSESRLDQQAVGVGLQTRWEKQESFAEGTVSFSSRYRHYTSPSPADFPLNEYTQGQAFQARLEGGTPLWQQSLVRAGAQGKMQSYALSPLEDGAQQLGVFTELEQQLPYTLTLLGGARAEWFSKYATSKAFHLELKALPKQEVSVGVRFARGFKSPALAQLHGAFGNPNLQPEFVTEIQSEAEMTWNRWSLLTSVYYQDFNNLIQSTPPTWLPYNISRVSSYGLESTVRGTWRVFTPEFFLAWNRTTRFQSSRQLPRRPEWQTGAALTFQHRAWTVTSRWTVSGERWDLETGTDVLPVAVYWDLMLNYQWTPSWSTRLRIDNVLGRDNEEAKGYASSGLSIFASLAYAWTAP